MTTTAAIQETTRHRAHWVGDQLICSCTSEKFTIRREPVARKVHTRNSRRVRRVGICERGHKSRIGFPSNRRK
jgi:hypothetical protein